MIIITFQYSSHVIVDRNVHWSLVIHHSLSLPLPPLSLPPLWLLLPPPLAASPDTALALATLPSCFTDELVDADADIDNSVAAASTATSTAVAAALMMLLHLPLLFSLPPLSLPLPPLSLPLSLHLSLPSASLSLPLLLQLRLVLRSYLASLMNLVMPIAIPDNFANLLVATSSENAVQLVEKREWLVELSSIGMCRYLDRHRIRWYLATLCKYGASSTELHSGCEVAICHICSLSSFGAHPQLPTKIISCNRCQRNFLSQPRLPWHEQRIARSSHSSVLVISSADSAMLFCSDVFIDCDAELSRSEMWYAKLKKYVVLFIINQSLWPPAMTLRNGGKFHWTQGLAWLLVLRACRRMQLFWYGTTWLRIGGCKGTGIQPLLIQTFLLDGQWSCGQCLGQGVSPW